MQLLVAIQRQTEQTSEQSARFSSRQLEESLGALPGIVGNASGGFFP
jgi:hypothetical protein